MVEMGEAEAAVPPVGGMRGLGCLSPDGKAPKLAQPQTVKVESAKREFDDPVSSSRSGAEEEQITLAAPLGDAENIPAIVKDGPDFACILARQDPAVSGFSEPETSRMRRAFKRYTELDSFNVQVGDLREVLVSLGYLFTSGDQLSKIAAEVTKFQIMDFPEFAVFTKKFAIWDSRRLNEAMHTHTGESGQSLPVTALQSLMQEAGVFALKSTVLDILAVAGLASKTELTFDELIRFLGAYRVTEGSTSEELAAALEVFGDFASEGGAQATMPAADLGDALLKVFTPYLTSIRRSVLTGVPGLLSQSCNVQPKEMSQKRAQRRPSKRPRQRRLSSR